MERDSYFDGVIVYRDLFLKIIKTDNQDNVRQGYIKYIVTNDNNIIMCFACKDSDNPYQEYLQRKK